MNILFVSSGNTKFEIIPFIRSQAESLSKLGITVDHFIVKEKGLIGYTRSISLLKKHLKTKPYDIIHAHYSFCGWVAVLARPRIPIIISLMGSDVYGLVNHKGKRKLKSYLEIVSSQLLQPFVDKIIVKSKNLLNYISFKRKALIIPNGVDFDFFKPQDSTIAKQELKLPLNKKAILFLGNPEDPRKNFNLVKEAYQLIDKNEYEIINPYPVLHEFIPLYLNAADVVTLTSFLEGSPNVIKEAMACNKPIVSTEVGDVKEVIGKTHGCYLTRFDARDMATKIELAAKVKGTSGRKDIEHLEINTIAKNLIKLYESLISTNYEKYR